MTEQILAPVRDDGPVRPPSDDEVYLYLGPQRRWVQLCIAAAFVLGFASIVAFSVRSEWIWPLLAVLAVNGAASATSLVTSLQKRRIDEATHRGTIALWALENPVGPSVDIFLPTCGEPIDILRNTYFHVRAIEWNGPLRVVVLDDGNRREVEDEARAFGFDYLVRPNPGYIRKAGNIQHAFLRTDGEFIVILDADFCPRRDFLGHLMPYTADRNVGIVQSPQYFSTMSSMGWLERTAGATQELFYRWIQPSRDRAGAPICVGTSAVYRRAALAAVGGFAQIEHSEDIHTGLRLLRAGIRTQYVPVVVSKGLCPSSLASFLNQQYRWCNGTLTSLQPRSGDKPLSLMQRLCFWSGLLYYVSTAVNVFAMSIPSIVMATVFADEIRVYHLLPFILASWVYFVLLPRVSVTRWRFEVVRAQIASSLCHALAIVHMLTGRTKGWVPTGVVGNKGSSVARQVSVMGTVVISATIVAAWSAWTYDVHQHGLHQFWSMGLFLIAYTYLGVPLVIEFLRILGPVKWRRTRRTGSQADPDGGDDQSNPITIYEVVAYTALIALIAVVAAGYFDLFIPWGRLP
jgi:cellulose synthase (UDP-forming)